MKKQAVRHQIVEHLSRLGDASLHKVGNSEDEFAEVYHYHNTLEVVIVRQGGGWKVWWEVSWVR